MPTNIHNSMIYRLRGTGRGFVFSPKHFLDLGSRDAVDKALSRLTKQGYINRISRGIYYYPKISPTLGILTPSITEIAKVLADKHKTQLQITGAEAVNILGLSNQVPARSVFFTDGQTKNIKVGKKTIELKHASPKKWQLPEKPAGLFFRL